MESGRSGSFPASVLGEGWKTESRPAEDVDCDEDEEDEGEEAGE